MDENARDAALKRWHEYRLKLKDDVRVEFKGNGRVEAEMRVPDCPEWVVSALFAQHEERLVLVELRILPAEDRWPPKWYEDAKWLADAEDRVLAGKPPRPPATKPRPPIGQWSQDSARLDELKLGGGLPMAMLKSIRFAPLFDAVQTHAGFYAAKSYSRQSRRYASYASLVAPEVYEKMAEAPNPGRHRRDDLHWAEWARRIDEATKSSRQPITVVAEDTGFTREQVRDTAHNCRAYGFLSPPIPGRGGGELTDKARQILKAAARKRKREGQ